MAEYKNAYYDGNVAYAIPQYIPEQDQEIRVEPQLKPQKQILQKTASLSIFSVVGFALVIVMLFAVLYSWIEYARASAMTVSIQENVDVLTAERRKLTVIYEQAYDADEIETYAVTKLGMAQPADCQVSQASIQATDKAIVINSGSSERNVSVFEKILVTLCKIGDIMN